MDVILGIDTSTGLTTVALVDHDTVVAQASHWDARRHAEVIGPMLAQVLSAADGMQVSRIVCGVGPGAYTGLRVGIAAARAVGLARGIEVVGVCSLDAIAAAAQNRFGAVVVATDARRSEVYWAGYSATGLRTDGPQVGAADLVDVPGTWLGHGAALHARLDESLRDLPPQSPLMSPTGEWIARVGRVGAPALSQVDLSVHGGDGSATARALHGHVVVPPFPLYLRRPDAVAQGGRP
jgi:tRNA threonylcarbamoyladenosine biosynthesis protein TsaB